jgi:hypothetical protein
MAQSGFQKYCSHILGRRRFVNLLLLIVLLILISQVEV